MGLYGFVSGNERIKGTIGYFGLEEWWLSAFSDEERRYVQGKFQPLGSSGDSLTSGEITYSSQSAVGLLHALAGWFANKNDRSLAYRMLDQAEELSKLDANVLDVHFLFGEKLSLYYKDRDNPGYLEKAIDACKQQIALADKAARAFQAEYRDSPLPGHKGYQQLAIILEKQMDFEEAIALCSQAEKQGWAGDWAKRIERCKKKLKNG
jgi:tetratricopeptide (TPR) repeat protein